MPKAKLNECSVDYLVSLLSGNTAPNLIELDISWNELTSISMQKIIKGLKNNKKLQILNLSWNEMKEDIDISPLTHFIRANHNLIHLDLSKTFNSDSHIRKLIKAIKYTHSLQSVHLSAIPIIQKSKSLLAYIN